MSIRKNHDLENNKKNEFDDDLFETRLEALKDTQEGIQQMSAWCLENRSFHKKIVQSWLNAFKKTRVEQRLVLFYLANDVIQNSKRKKYEFVEGWATALQRATTMVRDEKVKHKVLRIFKIWGERDIYSDDYLSDLKGLLNMNPKKKIDTAELSSDEFSNNKLIAYVRDCVQNADATDRSLKKMPKMPYADAEALKQQLKDKTHTEDVEKDLDRYITYMKLYYKNLQTELISRRTLLSEIAKARKFYRSQFGEVKVVAAAYKNFGLRIKILQKKLNEITPNLPSPIPSPDINAPSPEPDTDLQLPEDHSISTNFFKNSMNGYSSYLDGNLPFDINDFKDELGPRIPSQPIEVIGTRSDEESYSSSSHTPIEYYKPSPLSSYSSTSNVQIPGLNSSIPSLGQSMQSEYTSLARSSAQYGNILPPPPNPVVFDTNAYSSLISAYSTDSTYLSNSPSVSINQSTNNNTNNNQPHAPPPPIPPTPVSNQMDRPLSQLENWSMPWTTTNASNSTTPYNSNLSMIETPASPASRYDRDALNTTVKPIEYREQNDHMTQTNDVDHRQFNLTRFSLGANLGLSKDKTRQLDIDHRNLISLTGSPRITDVVKKEWPEESSGDIDYRKAIVPDIKQIETISTNPSTNPNITPSSSPIMPPPLTIPKSINSPQKSNTSSSSESQKDDGSIRYDPTDMVIDMDMSDEDLDDILREVESQQHQGNDTIDYAQMISSSAKAIDDTDTSDLLAQLQSTDENIESIIDIKPALLETPGDYNMTMTNSWDATASMNIPSFPENPTQLFTPRMPFPPNQQQFQPFIRGGGNGRGRGWSPHAMHSPYRPRQMRGGGGGVGMGSGFHGNGGRGGFGGNPFFNRGGNGTGFRGRRGNAWI